MHLEFQDLQHEWQWAEAARISSTYWPEDPVDGHQLQKYAAEFPADKFTRRVIAMQGEAPVAYVRMMQAFWFADQLRCQFGIAVTRTPEDEAIYGRCLDFVQDVARANGLSKVTALMRSDDTHLTSLLSTSGYAKGQVNPVSSVTTESFDFETYRPAVQAARDKGYRIMNLTEYIAIEPNWCRHLYDWDMSVMVDVPLPEPFKGIPYDDFERMTDNDTLTRDGYFLAIRDGVIAACTQINRNPIDGKIANTGLTGVLREHRRQGLATALKALSIDWAKQVGIERIYTDNEENNPMYQLNLAFGYRHVRDIVDYTKVLSERVA